MQQESTATATGGSGGVAISITDVKQSFVQGKQVVDAIEQVSLDVEPGKFVSLIGPSGCGKTTLLNMVAGVVFPTEGAVTLNGKSVTGPSPEISYMLARDALLPWRTVIENVMLGLETRGVPKAERHERARNWLERVGLKGSENARIWQMSQGMRQRAALARTLAMDPSCILMDEPFAAVDAQTRIVLQGEFLRLWERLGATVMFVTHDIPESVLLSDRVVLMSRRPGRILLDLEIDIPRPRTLDELRGTDKFIEYVDQISAAMEADRLAGTQQS